MENPEDKASLEGKGWDILAGGEDHASEQGGDDPFDAALDAAAGTEESPFDSGGSAVAGSDNPFDEPVGASLTAGGDNPFDTDPSTELLEGPGAVSEVPTDGPSPYGDWGRGGDRPDVSRESAAAARGGVEPRDLSPEELGFKGETGSLSPGVVAAPIPSPAPAPRPASAATSPPVPPRRQPATALPGTGPLSAGVEVERAGGPSEQARFSQPVTARAQFEDPLAAQKPEVEIDTDPTDDVDFDPAVGQMLVTPERMDALWDEINATYAEVVSDVRGHFSSTQTMLAKLKTARELLVGGTQYYDNTEVLVNEVKAKLELEVKVRMWSRTVGTWIAVYLVAWLVALPLMVMIQQPVLDVFNQLMPADTAAAYVPALWGGLGGVLGGLWVLIEHTARKRDFDPIHTRWYILNPFMGMGLGVVVYALFQMGVIVGGAGSVTPSATTTAAGGTNWLLYSVCLVVGFQQNVVWDLLDRVLQVIRPSKKEKSVDKGIGSGHEFD